MERGNNKSKSFFIVIIQDMFRKIKNMLKKSVSFEKNL